MNIPLARTRAVYNLSEVQVTLDRSKGRWPEREAFYERLLDNGTGRFVTTSYSTSALSPLIMDGCPNFGEVVGDLRPYGALANPATAVSSDERIKALVCIDGAVRYYISLVVQAKHLAPEKLKTPLLYLAQSPATM